MKKILSFMVLALISGTVRAQRIDTTRRSKMVIVRLSLPKQKTVSAGYVVFRIKRGNKPDKRLVFTTPRDEKVLVARR